MYYCTYTNISKRAIREICNLKFQRAIILGVLYTYLLAGSSTELQPATNVNGLPVGKLEGGEGSSQDREAIVPQRPGQLPRLQQLRNQDFVHRTAGRIYQGLRSVPKPVVGQAVHYLSTDVLCTQTQTVLLLFLPNISTVLIQ